MKLKRSLSKKGKKYLFIGGGVVLLLVIVGLIILLTSKKGSNKDNEPKKEPEIPAAIKDLKIVDARSTSRPFAVMINNARDARALQSGLQDAYIMYEIIVEGGITRYLALFMDQQTERIGSIRSARHYFIDYALENDAIYVHHGQSPQAQAAFSSTGVDRIVVDNSKTGWRDSAIKKAGYAQEHTLFTSIEKLKNGLSGKRTERKGNLLLNYSVDEIDMKAIPKSKVANSVAIKYSSGTTSSYKYDAEKKVYKRFVNGAEHKDYLTKEQYTFKNIITYQVENVTLNDGENKGRQDLYNTGSGTGYYISGGYAIPIKWEKADHDKQTKYYYEDGQELQVNDGNTFIQIQPKGQTLTIE